MAQGLKTASRKAAQQAQLDQLDALGSSKDDFDNSPLSVIEDIAADLILRIKANIQREKMVVTGDIEDITLTVDGDTVNVWAPDYLIFQDKGVNGSKVKKYNTPFSYKDKRPPVGVFLDWIKTKNLQLRDEEKKFYKDGSPFKEYTTEEKQLQLAHAIAGKVFNEGMAPRRIFTVELPYTVAQLEKAIPDFLKESVKVAFNLQIQDINIKL